MTEPPISSLFRNLPGRLSKKFRLLFQLYSIPRWMVLFLDNTAVFFVFLFAYVLRFNFVISGFVLNEALQHALLATGIYTVISIIGRSYSGVIRHTTLTDIFNVFIATSSAFTVLLILSLVSRWSGWSGYFNIPLSILIIHYVSITVILFFVRILIKITYQYLFSSDKKRKRVLIYGAGAMGIIINRVLASDPKGEYQLVGFLDDSKRLQGKRVNNIEVYNPDILNSDFLLKEDVEAMIIGIRDIKPARKSEIIRTALDLGLEVLDAPSMDTWLNGQFHAGQIRKVKLEDLLAREPIKLNIRTIGLGLTGRTILVTGTAGSIGSEIVRQLTRFKIRQLVLVDNAETPMFHLGNELKSRFNECQVQLLLADVTNAEKMERVFQEFHPDVVFHAAAYKHVPMMEDNPHEAIRVNVGGTKTMARLAVMHGVKKFVMISTDKAINPTNIMGASKRLCEMIIQLKSKMPGNQTQFIITRFGNVLGSNGSVIPLFSKQIEEGGPIKVTHPNITRYFMTIPEACQLVLEAGFMGNGGEIFVFDMGDPVKIVDLANQMIRLSGLTPGKDIKIEFIGLRPGEKLYEELLANKETTMPTHHPKIKIARVEELSENGLLAHVNYLLSNLYYLTKEDVIDYCKNLVPEYKGVRAIILNQLLIDSSPILDQELEYLFRHDFNVLRGQSVREVGEK